MQIDASLASLAGRGSREHLRAIRLDVTNRAAMAAAAEQTERAFGNLHVLVNNAGVGIQGPFGGITYALVAMLAGRS